MTEKVTEVIGFLEPTDQATINDMLSKAGLNGEATVDQLQSAFPHTNPNMTEGERIALLRLVFKRPNKFISKLDFTQRCEILALYRNGITREVLAKMYTIDRRTITHIYTTNSPHYKNVRAEEVGLGRDAFQAKYLTPDLVNKALAYKENNKGPENNKQASSKAGFHTVRGPMCDYDHRVEIKWLEADEKMETAAGWYYRDLDGSSPNQFFRGHYDESIKTSHGCYTNMIQEIVDKELEPPVSTS